MNSSTEQIIRVGQHDSRMRRGAILSGVFAVALVAVASHEGLALDEPTPQSPKVDSRAIAMAVEKELLSDDAVDGRDIDVTADQGIVTVSGKLDSLQAKRHATRAAKLIRGVRSVVNQMIVMPSHRDDNVLSTDIAYALQQDPATEAYEIIAVVQQGTARLGGSVDSFAERRLAEEVTAGVSGILDIDNRIEVKPKSSRPDAELAADVRGLIEASALLEDADIKVEVNAGVVVLNGVVGTAIEEEVAVDLASVSGVRKVESRGLAIDPSIRDGVRRRKRYADVTDERIEESVRLAIRHDPRVLSFADAIDVDSQDGVVTLRGTIEHFSAKRAAERAAANTLGVDRVSNKLEIGWDEAKTDDKAIETNVKAALGRSPYVSRHDILVRCRRAHVDLFGLVDSQFEKDIADWTTEMQKGVMHINNNLSVVREWEPRSDDEIQEAIDEKLEWTFFDRASEIEVNVENGVAILRGTVDTRRQWQRVMEIAVKAGARSPHNLLRIRLRPQRGRNPLYVPMLDSPIKRR